MQQRPGGVNRAFIALAEDDQDMFFDCLDASRQQGEMEAGLIECAECFAGVRDHPRYRHHPHELGIPEGVVAPPVV